MLIQLTDAEGRETWINPIHVKIVRTRKGMLGGGKGSEVWFSFHATSEAVYFSESPADIAAMLNAAMPPVIALDTSGDEPPVTNPQTGT
jgi:hypothetical protein